jgi:ligand-binding sensor domain-containing protein
MDLKIKYLYFFIALISLIKADQECYSVNNKDFLQSKSTQESVSDYNNKKKTVFQSLPPDFEYNSVRCIYKDYKGFMWFGTSDGLVKFDGINLTVYENDPRLETSISHNTINTIIEDNEKNLWIGTTEGLNLYCRDKDNFIRTGNMKNILSTLNSGYISALLCDIEGNIWIGTYGGVYVYNKKLNKLVNYRENSSPSISLNRVTSLAITEENKIWVGTQNGLNLFINEQIGFKQFYTDRNNPFSINNNTISKLCAGSNGILWIGTMGGGISKGINTGQYYKFEKISGHNSSGLSNNFVLSLASDNWNRLLHPAHPFQMHQ